VTRRPFTSTKVQLCAMLDLRSKLNLLEHRAWRKVSMKRKEKKESEKKGGQRGLYTRGTSLPRFEAKPDGTIWFGLVQAPSPTLVSG